MLELLLYVFLATIIITALLVWMIKKYYWGRTVARLNTAITAERRRIKRAIPSQMSTRTRKATRSGFAHNPPLKLPIKLNKSVLRLYFPPPQSLYQVTGTSAREITANVTQEFENEKPGN
jgi:hypothetical protein